MKPHSQLLVLMLVSSLLVSASFSTDEDQNRKEENCKWEDGSYNNQEYIRIIRQPSKYRTLGYLCWARSNLTGNVIFENTNNCNLAIDFVDGIRCQDCFKGFYLDGGRCLKNGSKPSDEQNMTFSRQKN